MAAATEGTRGSAQDGPVRQHDGDEYTHTQYMYTHTLLKYCMRCTRITVERLVVPGR